jgi:hypothetical protein
LERPPPEFDLDYPIPLCYNSFLSRPLLIALLFGGMPMVAVRCKSLLAKTTIAALLLCVAPTLPGAQTGSFVAPPRTIADITAILDQEKPDPARIIKLRADADAQPAADAGTEILSKFYFDRARARLNGKSRSSWSWATSIKQRRS